MISTPPLPERPGHHEPNLTDRVAALLLEEITSGRFKAGDVLAPEQAIADRFGVSRTVLREAVSRLKAEGLVSSKQGRGLVVMTNRRPSVLRLHAAGDGDVHEVLWIVELRLGFEIEAAAFAAQRRDTADVEEMRSALEQMRKAVRTGDIPMGVEADLRFHRAIAAATRNPNYVTFFAFLSELYRRNLLISRGRSARSSGRGLEAQKEHEAIFEAIERGDVEAARRAARAHVENTRARLGSAGNATRRAGQGSRKPGKKLLEALPK